MTESILILPRCDECGNPISCKEHHRVWCSQYEYCKTAHTSGICECNIVTHCLRQVNYRNCANKQVAFWFLSEANIHSPEKLPNQMTIPGYGLCEVRLARVPKDLAEAAGIGCFPDWLEILN